MQSRERGEGAVLRSVVDEDRLPRLAAGLERGLELLVEEGDAPFLVVDGDDDRDHGPEPSRVPSVTAAVAGARRGVAGAPAAGGEGARGGGAAAAAAAAVVEVAAAEEEEEAVAAEEEEAVAAAVVAPAAWSLPSRSAPGSTPSRRPSRPAPARCRRRGAGARRPGRSTTGS